MTRRHALERSQLVPRPRAEVYAFFADPRNLEEITPRFLVEAGARFVDVQLPGPYRRWEHTHRFEDAPGGGTLVSDRVEYELPLGPLGDVAHAVLVRRALARIFDFRCARIEALLGAAPRPDGGARGLASSP